MKYCDLHMNNYWKMSIWDATPKSSWNMTINIIKSHLWTLFITITSNINVLVEVQTTIPMLLLQTECTLQVIFGECVQHHLSLYLNLISRSNLCFFNIISWQWGRSCTEPIQVSWIQTRNIFQQKLMHNEMVCAYIAIYYLCTACLDVSFLHLPLVALRQHDGNHPTKTDELNTQIRINEIDQ